MKSATQSSVQDLPKLERAEHESAFFSRESVLKVLKSILAGSELSEVLTTMLDWSNPNTATRYAQFGFPMPMERISIV
jgi:hypothetical protein